MRVVTGQTRQGLGALVTAALMHLLHVAGHRHGRRRHFQAKVVAEILQGQTGSELAELSSARQHRGAAVQMAILADGLGCL